MEESEQRRERLKAMRMEAALEGVSSDSQSSGFPSHTLSNPLIENQTEAASAAPPQYAPRRFDYYTDPMAAFSGSKRTNNIPPQVSDGYYNAPPRPPMHQNMTPPPAYQNPRVNPPGQGMFQEPRVPFNQNPYGFQTEAPRPLGGYQGNNPGPLGGYRGNPPGPWGGSGGHFNSTTRPNFSRGGRFTTPNFVRGNSPHVDHGRGQRYNSSSQYDSGRGGVSQGSWTSGRRGAGPRGPVSAEQHPESYYRKEMVEDPWKPLKPVIWKGVGDHGIKPWLPKSIAMKKAKVSPEASQAASIPQPSLAEFLAASFNDPTNEDQTS